MINLTLNTATNKSLLYLYSPVLNQIQQSQQL